MNCVECQTDPLTPGHYCPCCGRKLSLEELRAAGFAVPASAPAPVSEIVTNNSHDPRQVPQRAAAVETTPHVMAPPPPAVNADEIRMAKAKAVADQTAQAHLAKAANPTPPVVRRPVVPVPPPPQRASYTPKLVMAAAVIVAAIGAAEGARRLGIEWPAQDVREAPPVETTTAAVEAAVETVTPPQRRAMPRETPASTLPVETKASPRPAARPTSVPTTGQRAAVRETPRPVQQAAPVVARAASTEIAASTPAKAPAPAAAASARASAPLTGRFFESNDVDEPPRIASRVAPRLPANLPAGAEKKIVVARVLVSRSGHPHRVSLLRGSMLGRASDEAVVAALAQWTFSPAKKQGEPVNCWYNFGVPLGLAD